MSANYSEIQELLQQRADFQVRLNLMSYDGNPEIKEQNGSKYLYVRKEIAGKSTSKYVDVYSDELYQLLLCNAKEAREINKSLRKINKELVAHGYEDKELSARVLRNLDFARANMKTNIYDQAILEGIATSFPQTEDIIENGIVNGVSSTDVQKYAMSHCKVGKRRIFFLMGGVFGVSRLRSGGAPMFRRFQSNRSWLKILMKSVHRVKMLSR